MNRKKLILTSLPLVLIVIALVAGFIFFPESFDLRNKAFSPVPTTTPRPDGAAQMLQLRDVTAANSETQSYAVELNTNYRPDAQVSSFETEIVVKSQNGQVLGDSDTLVAQVPSQAGSTPLTQAPRPPVSGTTTRPTTSNSGIKCDPRSSTSCGYGSRCISQPTPAPINCSSTDPNCLAAQKNQAAAIAQQGIVGYCSIPTYCFGNVIQSGTSYNWSGCKGPALNGAACPMALIPLTESEINEYKSWVTQGKPANIVCDQSTKPIPSATSPVTLAPEEQIQIWAEGNVKITTTKEIQEKMDITVVAILAPDNMSQTITVKGTPKPGVNVSRTTLKLATLSYNTQKFSRKVSAEITRRSVMGVTAQTTTPFELITTPTATKPTTVVTNTTCGMSVINVQKNPECGEGRAKYASVGCTNGMTTQVGTGACTDIKQLTILGTQYCDNLCNRPTTSPTVSRPATPTPCTQVTGGPSGFAACDGGVAGTYRRFTVTCSDGYTQDFSTTNISQCWSVSQITFIVDQTCRPRSTCGGTITPSPTVYTPPISCGASCTTNSQCGGSLVCMNGACRNPGCPSGNQVNCACQPTPTQIPSTYPTPIVISNTPTPTPVSCGNNCSVNSNCSGGLACISGTCMNPSCAGAPGCNCQTGPTPIVISVTPTPSTTQCPPSAPACPDGQLAMTDNGPNTCPTYQCVPTPTPTCAPWNILCRVVPTPTPTSAPTGIVCPTPPACKGQLAIAVPSGGNACPIYQCLTSAPTTSPCPAWNLVCRVTRPTITPTPTSIRPTPTPVVCPKVYQPVCGADGRTYNNPCEANLARVKMVSDGVCRPTPTSCPWWNLVCRTRPPVTLPPQQVPVTPTPVVRTGSNGNVVCSTLYQPVCATNGVTYSNECQANVAGMQVAYNGACN